MLKPLLFVLQALPWVTPTTSATSTKNEMIASVLIHRCGIVESPFAGRLPTGVTSSTENALKKRTDMNIFRGHGNSASNSMLIPLLFVLQSKRGKGEQDNTQEASNESNASQSPPNVSPSSS
ncbi:uncharacterized protein LOC142784965 isoform X2 [Rhipicephalus microplus]|uniref:uncharacterized protein LOC142784965 isoform X2 n=1 Tax=Rhipicephalus microplus TaxID=6941 RepID=UPI003F6BFB31